MTDNEFLYSLHMDRECILQFNRLVEHDAVFRQCLGKRSKRPSMLHITLLLKYLGGYGNQASLQKISRAMVISNGAVNECVNTSLSDGNMLSFDKLKH